MYRWRRGNCGRGRAVQLSEEQIRIRDSVRDYVQDNILPHAAEWDRSSHFPAAQLREMGELGLFGMLVPEQWGGSETGYVAFALALEEVAAGDGACSTILSVNNSVVCGSLLGSGSDYLNGGRGADVIQARDGEVDKILTDGLDDITRDEDDIVVMV